MRLAFAVLLVLGAMATVGAAPAEAKADWLRPELDADVARLLSALTLPQKVGQMLQMDIVTFLKPNTFELDADKLAAYTDKYYIGSILNAPTSGTAVGSKGALDPAQWRTLIRQIQEVMVAHGSKIPAIYGLDTVHGANYIHSAALFPQQLAVAATFNRSHAHISGVVGAKDTRYVGIPWVFSPILDLATHQAWPRFWETFGEDTYLIEEMGKAIITGYQGNGSAAALSKPTAVAACAKHFVGYAYPRNGQDKGPVWIAPSTLRNRYFPAFKAGIDANVRTTMEAYHELNGEPLGSSARYLNALLRDDLGFKGLLVTDYNVVNDLKDLHHAAANYREATRLAIGETSIDMSMVPSDPQFFDHLMDLVKTGVIPESRLDASVGRILQLKKDLGLYENPFPPNIPNTVGQQADWDAAVEAAREGIVLLKNQGNILPLALNAPAAGAAEETKGTAVSKILVAGPTGNNLISLSGGWSIHWQGALSDDEFPRGVTVFQGIKDMAGAGISTTFQQGVNMDGTYSKEQFDAAINAARESDIVFLALGEGAYAEAPGNIGDLTLPAGQMELARALYSTGKPVVLVLVEGRPRVLNGIAGGARAVLFVGLQGPMAGAPLAEIIFGVTNPSGRLPFTYAKSTNAVPLQYWHTNSHAGAQAEWWFGEGLSYTTFSYRDLTLNSTTVKGGVEGLKVSVTVSNTGSRAGREAVLLFLRQDFRTVPPEARVLKGFEKVLLSPGQSTTLSFSLPPSDFMFYNTREKLVFEPGAFTVSVGPLSTKLQLVA